LAVLKAYGRTAVDVGIKGRTRKVENPAKVAASL